MDVAAGRRTDAGWWPAAASARVGDLRWLWRSRGMFPK